MNTYAAVLLWAIPGFMVLVFIEIIYGHFTNKQSHVFMDTLASLSSGMTNILKDVLGLAIILISYPLILEKLAFWEVEGSMGAYIIAFICIDFASYIVHILNHKVNIFWNQHFIHHSSEEYNLACALRQSISNLIGFGAIFLIPAALFGVPTEIIMILSPIHLFAQFWYHTKHIGKLGFLEYIIVTPSQHRVHHAINPIYIDKNLSAIFCVWDRIFGTFQEELEDEPPIYGTLKPSLSWNPIWINFQHLYLLARDAWYTKKWKDKLSIWFMPTGWRPKDVSKLFPIIPREINENQKYKPHYDFNWKVIAVIHFVSITLMILFFLSKFSDLSFDFQINFSLLIFFSIFGFTSLMDYHSWAPYLEILRGIASLIFIILPQTQFLQLNSPLVLSFLVGYFSFTILIGFWSRIREPSRKLALE
jgi:sterol desaturase/sphingolipid hydroxylase (fatty acid hydroxylase superfamily)